MHHHVSIRSCFKPLRRLGKLEYICVDMSPGARKLGSEAPLLVDIHVLRLPAMVKAHACCDIDHVQLNFSTRIQHDGVWLSRYIRLAYDFQF